jgi:hypothetical protein
MNTLPPALSNNIRFRDLLLNALTSSGAIVFRNRAVTENAAVPVLAGFNRVR